MSAIELFKEDGTTAGVFFCSECRCVYVNKEMADWCHGDRLCACGKKIERGYRTEKCDKCRSDEMHTGEALKEAARFEKAKKITEAERKEGRCLSSGCDSGNSPEEATEQHWRWITDPKYYIVIGAYSDNRRAVRWNGFMWEDVAEEKPC